MPWIRVNEEFPEDPRLDRVAAALGKPHEVAAMLVLRLWCWAAKHLEDGVLDGIAPASLARHIGWRGDPSRLHAALEGEFVQVGRLLDWEDVSGRLQIARKREAFRSSKRRELAKADRVVDRQTVGRSTATEKEKENEKENESSTRERLRPENENQDPPPVSPSRGKRATKGRTEGAKAIPEDWSFGDAEWATAERAGCPSREAAALTFEKFKNHYLESGETSPKWNLRWSTWCANARDHYGWAKPTSQPQPAASKPKYDALAGMHAASLTDHRRREHPGEFDDCTDYRCVRARQQEEEFRGKTATAGS